MIDPIRKFLMVSATAALSLVPAAAVVSLACTDAAFAKNDNGGGNGGGNNGGNGRGNDNANSGGKPDHAGNRGNGRSSGSVSRGNGNGNGKGLFGVFRNKSNTGGGSRTNGPKRAPSTTLINSSPTPKIRPNGPAVQSQLKWLNAANASLNAYVNASPDSRVGQIATYRAALLEYEAASADPAYLEELDGYVSALRDFAPEGTTDAEIDALLAEIQDLDAEGENPEDDALIDILAELNPDATEAEIEELAAELEDAVASDNEIVDLAEARDDALTVASDGLVLDPDSAAWNHFHELLRLDQELPVAGDAAEAGDTEGAETLPDESDDETLLVAD